MLTNINRPTDAHNITKQDTVTDTKIRLETLGLS